MSLKQSSSLSVVVAIHKFAWNTTTSEPDQLRVSVPVMDRVQLASLLGLLANLSTERAGFLLQYLTCEIDRWKNKNSSDALIQSIVELDDKRVALSPSLILEGNVAHNILLLINHRKPKLSIPLRISKNKPGAWN